MLTVLGTKWSTWDMLLWASNNTLSGLNVRQIFEFIDIIDEICNFMTDKFVSTHSQEELLKALKFWEKITFLREIYIINKMIQRPNKMNVKKIINNYYYQ